MTTYKVVRFTFNENHPDNRRVITQGLTLAEAQTHCQREDTHGENDAMGQWFDGFEEEF